MLYTLTVTVNFIDLVVAVWLGTYIISRSPRSLMAWLAGLTFWSLAGFFFNVLLALNPPPSPTALSRFLIPLLWFWPSQAFNNGWVSWMQGWQVIPAIFFWHHVTVLMLPGSMNPWRATRVIAGYLIALVAIFLQRSTDLLFTTSSGDPLYLTSLVPGRLFAIFMLAVFLFTMMSLINLVRAARDSGPLMPKKQLYVMIVATLIAGLSVPIDLAANRYDILVPRVILSILFGCSVFLIGYAVARYSALMDGRVLGRDFLYNGVAIGAVAALYLMVVWSSVLAYRVPIAAVAGVVILAILTHSLVDISRSVFDFFFYRRETRELRAKLRSLAHQASESEVLDETLAMGLEAVCTLVHATYGLIFLPEGDSLQQAAAWRWKRGRVQLEADAVMADDAVVLEAGRFGAALEDAALLIPLYAGEEQRGALILGRPENAMQYSASDVEHVLELSDHLADAVRAAHRENERLARLAELAAEPHHSPGVRPESFPVKVLEEALRNLHDYAYLGDSPFITLKRVRERIPAEGTTHLDRGKHVCKVLTEALEKLRPSGDIPRESIPRQWYPYLILHDAYLGNKPNRDIMLRLYISEGTFNRTRRAAIRSLARVVNEMEN